ncbi:MAG: phenylalanine--tRNA ligase beta subunit-related protein, partial [Candidatus Chromulinivorax sp.]
MKISVNWLFDHIATKVSKVDVGLIAAKFNVHTAEIEHYEKHDIAVQDLFLVSISLITDHSITAFCKELNQEMILPLRKDLQVGQFAFVRRLASDFSWEKLSVYSAAKEGLFPAVDCQQDLVAGGWKKECEVTDYIIDVDNKSINHRPDLWGHRGIAREIAAFMGWQLKSIDEMLAQVPEVDFTHTSIASADHSLKLSIKDTTICSRFAGLYCQDITHKPSQIWMAMRLARVDSKPINSIVDITNYVMFDISQPMHVFDAANFADKKLEVRKALPLEQLELLDGRAIDLTEQDIVVTDGAKAVALAGVMGGKQASFSSNAQAIIIESGNFAAAMVRNSAARAKVSTEACIRFAKQLDPMQNTIALQRFVFIAQAIGVVGDVVEKVVSLGKQIESATIAVSHRFIENKLGITLSSDQIVTILEKLDFQIIFEQVLEQERSFIQKWFGFTEQQTMLEQDIIYQVQVPTYRMTKDITIPEDIVEEIARLYGFDTITYQRPKRVMKTFDMSNVIKLRTIKEHCAFAMRMREVKDYLFYDESFLRRLDWYPTDAVAIKNPVSENWKVLVTSLIPHLIKNVELNAHGH